MRCWTRMYTHSRNNIPHRPRVKNSENSDYSANGANCFYRVQVLVLVVHVDVGAPCHAEKNDNDGGNNTKIAATRGGSCVRACLSGYV